MNRQPFYDYVTPGLFRGTLPMKQQEPMDRIIDEGIRRERTVSECAYVLASSYHESDRFLAKKEYGDGAGKAYGTACPLMGTGSRVTKSAVYYGRSPSMETWLENYADLTVDATLAFGKPINFVVDPDLLIRDLALQSWALWDGFIMGRWTAKNLSDYRDEAGSIDYVEARRIVNGTDKADLIAGYAREFEAGLRLIDGAPASVCPTCGRAA